jgi:glycolate oxidase FAD binding subunit
MSVERTDKRANLAALLDGTGVTNVRPGEASHAVLGVVPEVVARPASVEEISRLLAWANREGLAVVIRGSGTKMDRGAPPLACHVLLDASGVAGVVEHAAGDLTVTVRAGTLISDLQATLRTSGQWLALDPPLPGSVGGLIATGDSGPRRLRYGGVRDLILGVKFVRADGVVARGGGKVVKNVAGYDLPKLLTGSLGTLGVIVEATFRLYPLPALAVTALAPATARQAGTMAAAVLQSPVVPTALDYIRSAHGQGGQIAVRFEGSERAARAQAESAVRTLGAGAHVVGGEDERALWTDLRAIMHTEAADVLAHLVCTQSDLSTLIESAESAAVAAGIPMSIRAHVGHGHALLRWHAPDTSTAVRLAGALRRGAEARGGNLVLWRTPMNVRAELDVWGDVGEGLPLMRRVKAQFDPNNVLNPGRFVGGI